MDGESSADSESEADIPIFVPVPFEELSSIQYYSAEEQLLEFTAALKEQYQRHCFIKIPQEDAQPMLVPFVERFHTSEKNVTWYEEKLLEAAGALPPEEVDRLIQAREENLLNELERDTELPEDFRE